MISKSIEKYVNSLKQKKYRIEEGHYIAEGEKIAEELLHSDQVISKLIATKDWFSSNERLERRKNITVIEATEQEMKRISGLVRPSNVLLVVAIPPVEVDEQVVLKNLSLVLDGISDPGNLGTIVRIADWFGIPYIFCSEDSADVYNPKVVQASMGSIARVKVTEMPLADLFRRFPSMPVYATALEGESIYSATLSKTAFIVIGNEARGISEHISPFVTRVLTIPKSGGAESLNAAVAAGIVCAMFRKD